MACCDFLLRLPLTLHSPGEGEGESNPDRWIICPVFVDQSQRVRWSTPRFRTIFRHCRELSEFFFPSGICRSNLHFRRVGWYCQLSEITSFFLQVRPAEPVPLILVGPLWRDSGPPCSITSNSTVRQQHGVCLYIRLGTPQELCPSLSHRADCKEKGPSLPMSSQPQAVRLHVRDSTTQPCVWYMLTPRGCCHFRHSPRLCNCMFVIPRRSRASGTC